MGNDPDVAEVAADLVLTLDPVARPASLHCAGTLDTRTRQYVLKAVRELLACSPASVRIDVSELRVADSTGANTLAHVQRMVRQHGATIHWRGLDADHLRGDFSLSYRARRHLAGGRPVASTFSPLGPRAA